ncbi:polyprenyl synthetase family protein [Veillonella sp. VA137]|uniref:polyprenyl synthetase family protein n=1 Tax=Veillonella sp. VA137 TaxID=741828 RepID=UPI000F8D4567|nr:farnesyl diphosphate synthase [Veillonella sp. VA137]
MLKEYLQQSKADIESYLSSVLESPNTEYARVYDSMNYSLLMGGKRIRPIITKAVIESLGGSWEAYKDVVCAIELIHTYSLIHDDLPAMDNDDYRRGKLTNHRVYGDGMAILAGDGLLTYAFELVSKHTELSAEQVVQIIHVLAKGAGPSGMVGGQAFDLQSEGKFLPLDELIVLHKGKTGALFSAAVEIGLIIVEATTSVREAYLQYADHLGLLFQITDDILDVVGTQEELGKTPGSDERQHKATYVSILGLDTAKERAQEVAHLALTALHDSNQTSPVLEGLVQYLMDRTQ